MKIVGLSGAIGSGKSHLAKHAMRELPTGWRIAVADPLREELVRAGFDTKWIYADPKPVWVRRLMQAYGQAKRAQDTDYWARKLAYRVEELGAGASVVVVDDIRFPNEADTLHMVADKMGGVARIIKVKPMIETITPSSEFMECDSEQSMFDYDFNATIVNRMDDKTCSDFVAYVEDL